MKQSSLYLTLATGAVGMLVGASSAMIVEARVIGPMRHRAASVEQHRPSPGDVSDKAYKNMESRGKKNVNAVYPTNTYP